MTDDFCPRCDVLMSLHPEDSDWGCEMADEKAALVGAFFGAFQPQHRQYDRRTDD